MSGTRSVVVALLAGLAGGAAVSFALNPPARDAATSPVSASDAELLAELRRVREEIVHLGARLAPAGASMPSMGPAAAAAPGRAGDDRLAAAMDRLASALESRAPGSATRAPVPPPAATAAQPRPSEEIRSMAEKAMSGGVNAVRTYRFWTYQQMLDRFGPPDAMYPQEGYLWWTYVEPDDAGRYWSLRIQFFDGFVVAMTGSH